MLPLILKNYQQAALDALATFARAAALKGPALAFRELAGRPYLADAFGEVPCVCLRIPTGGGKTVMAAHAVPLLAREWRATDAPVAVWLVPSDTIRGQTLRALQTPGHPYREALAAAYGDGLQVCALEDVAQIAPPEWGRQAVVVVATIQSFRIEDAGQRNVYSFSESFEPHFRGADARRLAVLQGLPTQPLFEQKEAAAPAPPAQIATSFIAIVPTLELLALPGVQVAQIAGAQQVVLTGHIGAPLEDLMLAQVRGPKKQAQLREQVAQHNALVAAQGAPASRGVRFAPVPTLGYRTSAQAPLWPLERAAVLEAVELDLLTPAAVQLPGFQVVEQSNTFEIYVKDARVKLRAADASQIAMDYGASSITAEDLVRWLDQSLFQKLPELTQSQRRAYLAAVVNHLLHERHVPLVVLAQARFRLAQDIEARVADLGDQAARRQFHQLVLHAGDAAGWLIEPDWAHPHVFEPGRYPAPAGSRYAGRYQFPKHYFPVLADLKDEGQEFACAQQIDSHPKVRHWVRNLDTAPCGFALPTSRGRFFPDFVTELMDGRIAVMEFKGAHLANDPYEIEKRQVGALWARASDGRAVFDWLLVTRDGLDLRQQLDRLLA